MSSNRSYIVIGAYVLLLLITFVALGSLSDSEMRILQAGRSPGDVHSSTPGIVGALFYVTIAATYFLPTIVAVGLRHPMFMGVALINTVAGWTGLGWIISFVWACSRPKSPEKIIHLIQPPPLPQVSQNKRIEIQLESLAQLRDRKVISEEEYLAQRTRILDSVA